MLRSGRARRHKGLRHGVPLEPRGEGTLFHATAHARAAGLPRVALLLLLAGPAPARAADPVAARLRGRGGKTHRGVPGRVAARRPRGRRFRGGEGRARQEVARARPLHGVRGGGGLGRPAGARRRRRAQLFRADRVAAAVEALALGDVQRFYDEHVLRAPRSASSAATTSTPATTTRRPCPRTSTRRRGPWPISLLVVTTFASSVHFSEVTHASLAGKCNRV